MNERQIAFHKRAQEFKVRNDTGIELAKEYQKRVENGSLPLDAALVFMFEEGYRFANKFPKVG